MGTQQPSSLNQHQEAESTRLILDAIESRNRVTQRDLAAELGIALGLTNTYLKRCLNKGLIKVRRAPARRYAYNLTSRGVTEKARLTAKFLRRALSFFREARQDCLDLFIECRAAGIAKVGFVGAGELCEIASLAALDSELEVVAVLDDQTNRLKVAGIPVVRSLEGMPTYDIVVITDTVDPQARYDILSAQLAPGRVVFPKFLRLSGGRGSAKEGRR